MFRTYGVRRWDRPDESRCKLPDDFPEIEEAIAAAEKLADALKKLKYRLSNDSVPNIPLTAVPTAKRRRIERPRKCWKKAWMAWDKIRRQVPDLRNAPYRKVHEALLKVRANYPPIPNQPEAFEHYVREWLKVKKSSTHASK